MSLKNSQAFGKLIRDTRKVNRVTQKDLAAACGTGVRFIRELEKGKATCELGKALLVAAVLGIRLEATLPPAMTANPTPMRAEKGAGKPARPAKGSADGR